MWGNLVSPRPRPAGEWGNLVSPFPHPREGLGGRSPPKTTFLSHGALEASCRGGRSRLGHYRASRQRRAAMTGEGLTEAQFLWAKVEDLDKVAALGLDEVGGEGQFVLQHLENRFGAQPAAASAVQQVIQRRMQFNRRARGRGASRDNLGSRVMTYLAHRGRGRRPLGAAVRAGQRL